MKTQTKKAECANTRPVRKNSLSNYLSTAKASQCQLKKLYETARNEKERQQLNPYLKPITSKTIKNAIKLDRDIRQGVI